MPYNRYTEVAGTAPLYVDGFFANLVTDASTYPWFSTKGSWNARMWHFSSPKVDALLEEARRTADPEQQRNLYRQFQKEIVEQAPGVIAYVTNVATAYRTDVKNYKTNPFLWLDLLDVENTARSR
jgi:peptide/nickel transport system substrate-binding protein